MSTFININFTGKTANKFIYKHIFFSLLWILAFAIILFRFDLVLLNKMELSIPWIEVLMPFVVILIGLILMLTQKWYYSMALIFYPLLAIGWFLPKWILQNGKIYLFWSYVNSILKAVSNFKWTLIKIIIGMLAILIILVFPTELSRYFAMIVFSSIYFSLMFNYLRDSFGPAKLFGRPIEKYFDEWILDSEPDNRFKLVKAFTHIKEDSDLSREDKRINQIKRVALLDFTLNFALKELNRFMTKRAFVISMIFQIVAIFVLSVLYFYFLNFQLFLASPSNFIINGEVSSFDFFYYTIKNITLSDINYIIPNSTISKIIEILSFFVLGIFILIILISSFVSFKKERIRENIIKIKKVISYENKNLHDLALEEFGKDIESAMLEVKDIKESMKGLKNILEKIF